MNASRPSEHPPVRGENVETFSRWDHRLQIQNFFCYCFSHSAYWLPTQQRDFVLLGCGTHLNNRVECIAAQYSSSNIGLRY